MTGFFLKLVCLLDRYGDRLVHAVAALILLAGFGYTILLGDALIYPDAGDYYAIAFNLARNGTFSLDGLSPTALFPPAYPVLLSLFVGLGVPVMGLRYLNFIALAACVYVIRSILRVSGAPRGRGVAAVLLAGYGVLFYTAGTLYTQTMFTLVLLLLIRTVLQPAYGYAEAIVFGMLSGLLIMIHSTGVFIPPLVVCWQVLPRRFERIAPALVSALVAVLCIAPWAYRNYVVFDRFIPFTSHGGDTLYIGNNPTTSLDAWYTYTEEEYYKEAALVPESEQNRYYIKKTLEFWTEQPREAIILYLRKLIDYFNYHNNLCTSSQSSRLKDLIMFCTYYPLLLCLVLRLLWTGRVPLSRTERLLVGIYLASALFHAVFLPRIRFRLPYDAVLIAHVGIMFELVRQRYAGRIAKPCQS